MARLAAFDMDGTLLMPDHHLGRETIATLARLRERDITLTFATGRHVLEMRHILGTLSLDAYLITVTGREFTRWKATCCIVRISILRLPIR